jgi:hypothetical protein
MVARARAQLLDALKEKAPVAFAQALGLTAGRRCQGASRVPAAPAAREARGDGCARRSAASCPTRSREEMLAVYFLECRNELLVEWLDAIVPLEHERARRKATRRPQYARRRRSSPSASRTTARSDQYADRADRELLLAGGFSAQSSIEWPELEKRSPPAARRRC